MILYAIIALCGFALSNLKREMFSSEAAYVWTVFIIGSVNATALGIRIYIDTTSADERAESKMKESLSRGSTPVRDEMKALLGGLSNLSGLDEPGAVTTPVVKPVRKRTAKKGDNAAVK